MKKIFSIILIAFFALTCTIGGGFLLGGSNQQQEDPSISAKAEGLWTDNAATSFAGGTGKINDPYLIATAEQLAYLAVYINAGSGSTKYYALTANINLSAHYWVPIGSYQRPFGGSFNGNGYTISGLIFDSTALEGSSNPVSLTNNNVCVGFFGYVYGAHITNFALNNANITVSLLSAHASANIPYYIGGIVGFANWYSIISNVHTFNLTMTETLAAARSSQKYMGGIVGYAYNVTQIAECQVLNYYSTVTDTQGVISNAVVDTGGIGGVVGLASGNVFIKDVAYLSINSMGLNFFSQYGGGLVGILSTSSKLSTSYFAIVANGSPVSQSVYGQSCSGGLCGYLDRSTILSCFSCSAPASAVTYGALVGKSLSGGLAFCWGIGAKYCGSGSPTIENCGFFTSLGQADNLASVTTADAFYTNESYLAANDVNDHGVWNIPNALQTTNPAYRWFRIPSARPGVTSLNIPCMLYNYPILRGLYMTSGLSPANAMVNYHPNGAMWMSKYTESTGNTLAVYTSGKTGFYQYGWNATKTCKETPDYLGKPTISGNYYWTFYANWLPIDDFNLNIVGVFCDDPNGSTYTGQSRKWTASLKGSKTSLSSTELNKTYNLTFTNGSLQFQDYYMGQTFTLSNISCMGYQCMGINSAGSSAITSGTFTHDGTSQTLNVYVYFKRWSDTTLQSTDVSTSEGVFCRRWFENGEFPQTAVVTYDTSLNTLLTSLTPTSTFEDNGITFKIVYYDPDRFLGFEMPSTRTVDLCIGGEEWLSEDAEIVSYTFYEGETYWFRFDPIRWRVGDYYETRDESELYEALGDSGGCFSNLLLASDVLWWDEMNESSNPLKPGDNSLQTTLVQKISSGSFMGGMNIQNVQIQSYVQGGIYKFNNSADSNDKIVAEDTNGANARYIRISSNGSNVNSGNHLKFLSIYTATDGAVQYTTLADAANDIVPTVVAGLCQDMGSYFELGTSLTIDIGSVEKLFYVQMFRYDNRTYYSQKIEYSEDGERWFTFWDSYNKGSYSSPDSTNLYNENTSGREFF